ncbi:helix-turn-helix domain-containing protein [Salinarimonas rosea]|uniref:helix-turn-helix domain-containing protein n=1 Tax=Salinarimonas rosea TaxID=552063 RepID=UPI0012ECA535|nr:helix-turn-helix domain-containing protein [Salinarimonas rosea]
MANRILTTATRLAHEHRRRHPHWYADPDLLFVENVATALGCSVDHVRRIPRNELPAARVGQRVIYRRIDVATYVAAKLDRGAPAIKGKPLGVQPARAVSFDPVRQVRTLLKEDQG